MKTVKLNALPTISRWPRVALVALVALFAAHVYARSFELYDNASDVDYLTPSYWKVGSERMETDIPGTGDEVVMHSTGNIDVYVSRNVSTNYSKLSFRSARGKSLRFHGADGFVFGMPSSSESEYNSKPIVFMDAGGNDALWLERGTSATNPIFSMEGADFTVSSAADSDAPTFNFASGNYNFYNPYGVTPASGRGFKVVNGANVIFGPGTSVQLPSTRPGLGSMFFSGGTASLASLVFDSHGKLVMDKGATVSISGGINLNNSTNPKLIVSNATLSVQGSGILGGSTDGTLRLVGGSMTLTGGDGIQVGNAGGNGTLEIEGGTMTLTSLRLSRSGAEANRSCVFRQTGGFFETENVIFQQSCKDNNLGTHYVKLEGGIAYLNNISRASTVTAGYAILSADGGTLRNKQDTSSLFNYLTRAEFGEKGLSLDTNGKSVTIANCPVVNKEGENGVFIKTGSGTAGFNGSTWSVSRTVVRDGTFKFAADVDSPTALSVLRGGTFSMAGDASSVAVALLSVTNAVIELDPGDVVTVNGPVSLSRAKILWTSLPEEEETMLVVDHELSAAEEFDVRTMLCANELGDGNHSEVSLVYDAETGKTTVKAKVAADERLTDSALWTGSGAWANASNWSSSSKPTSTTVATFGAAGAGTAVAVATGDSAGALAFTNSSYTISGESPLVISGNPGSAAVDVAAGSNTISALVESYATLGVTVAPDTSLSLAGGFSGMGVKKTGKGRMSIGGVSTIIDGVSSSDGFFSVLGKDALGSSEESAGEFRLIGGTFEYKGDAAGAYPGEFIVDSPWVMTSVVVKADSPLTLSNVSVPSGCIVKRGVAALTIAPGSNTTTVLTSSRGFSSNGSNTAGGFMSFGEDGVAPADGYTGFTVVEGDVTLKGDASTLIDFPHTVTVGGRCSQVSVQPSLTVDGAHVKLGSGSGNWTHLCPDNSTSEHLARRPRLNVRNGAYAEVGTLAIGRDCYEYSVPTVVVERATLKVGCLMPYNYQSLSTIVLDGACLYVGSVDSWGRSYIDATNSVFAKNAELDCMTSVVFNQTSAGGTWTFRSGTSLYLANIKNKTNGMKFRFDGATWETGGGEHPTFKMYRSDKMTIETFGNGGLTLPVAEGKTVTVEKAITGAGPVVKTGGGALVFGTAGNYNEAQTEKTSLEDPVTLAFGGVLDVRGGTVSVAATACREGGAYRVADGASVDFGGNTLTGATFEGAGSFANATLADATILCIIGGGDGATAVPTFGNVAFSGRVCIDAGRTEDNPLSPGEVETPVPVMKISGTTAFNPSQWRLKGTGVKNLGGEFELVGDTVYLKSLITIGAILIVY